MKRKISMQFAFQFYKKIYLKYGGRTSEPFCYSIVSPKFSHVIVALLVVGKSKGPLVKFLNASICISVDFVDQLISNSHC